MADKTLSGAKKMAVYLNEEHVEGVLAKKLPVLISNLFNRKVVFTERQHRIGQRFSGRIIVSSGVVDLYAIDDEGREYFFEVKNSKSFATLAFSIGQLLNYSLFSKENAFFGIFSTYYDPRVKVIIDKYKLPIAYLLLDENEDVLVVDKPKVV